MKIYTLKYFKSSLFIIIIILLTLNHSEVCKSENIFINEILPNPSESDNNKEFIEIKGTNNLSNYLIGDLSQNDSLLNLQTNNSCNYSLIVEEEFNFENLSCSIYSAGSTIGNGLSNNEDKVFLIYNNSIIDEVEYDGVVEGQSFIRINNSIELSDKLTPCTKNFIINESSNNSNTSNSSGNQSNNNTNLCNISLDLIIKENVSILNSGEVIKFDNELNNKDFEFIISYWITDYFNKTVKSLVDTSNSNLKQWTAKTKLKYEVFRIKNKLKQIDCNNSNNKTENEKLIFVINQNYEEYSETEEKEEESQNKIQNSEIKLNDIKFSDNEISFYSEIFKGETSKRLITFFVSCKNNENKEIEIYKFKTYVNKKQSEIKLGFKFGLNLITCNKDLLLCAEGLTEKTCSKIDWENNKLVEEKNKIFKQEKKENFSQIISFSKVENNISKYFQPNNLVKTGNKITGNYIEEKSEIYKNPNKIISFVIIFIMLGLLVIIFLKK